MEYKNRIADQLLRDKLEAMGAVLIEGPKACGKTTTAEQQAKSVIYMDDPTKQEQYRQMAQTNISFLLEGETPRLIDEWQEVPQFWDAIRFEVDQICEKTFGELYYYFMMACAVSGKMMGVNPFDQEGVEEYKRSMFAALGKSRG